MPDATHASLPTHQTQRFRAESETNSQDEPPSGGWRQAAIDATTLGELYQAARAAQAAGDWTDHDAAWCDLIRTSLGATDRAALALVRRELGGTPLDGAA